MRVAVRLAMAALAAAVLSGCVNPGAGGGSPPSGGAPAGASAGSAEGGATASSDAKLREALEAKIKADPELSKENVTIEVKDGQISLRGEVSTGAVKIQLEDLARSLSEGQMVNAEQLLTKE